MKKSLFSLAVASALFSNVYADDTADLKAQLEVLTQKIQKLEKKQDRTAKTLSSVKAHDAHDNIKFNVDFRTSYDNLNYKSAKGVEYKNDAIFSNRLWLGMGYAPTDTIVFKGQLAVNKAFGASYGQRGTGMGFDTFDWVLNETLTDDTIKLRQAYWLWTPTIAGFPTTWSVGRRPSTNGALINLRDDDPEQSPLGHVINMEFDGASASVKLDKFVNGMYFKICLGRGLTNAAGWASQASNLVSPFGMQQTPYPNYVNVDTSLDTSDFAGFIFSLYNDGQYSVKTTLYRGMSLPGLGFTYNNLGQITAAEMKTFGDEDGGAISMKIEGIGDEINDFLDETIVFASFAYSQTRPDDGKAMLGTTESKTGTSYWVGTQMPNLTGGRFGLEYNHGSKYWRPFTYGEDTLIGSKMATRGDAYEAYWTQPIIEKDGKSVFSMQVRYTYIDYAYTGSNAFFGDAGTPMKIEDAVAMGMDPIDTAQDIRVYFRYRY